MSLSWLDRLTLLVHPHRVVLERRPWRGATIRQEASAAPAAPGEAAWQPALAASLALLDARGKRGGSLNVVIADHFVRYALLPWSDTVCSPAARGDMARALLKSSFGETANTLEITVDRPVFGRPGVAAGIERDLLAALRTGARARRLLLSSIKPRLIAELATNQKEVGNAWFASIDCDRLTLAGLCDGGIACLYNHRLSIADPALVAIELAGLLAAGQSAVPGRRLLIAHGDVPVPTRIADWETRYRPYLVPGKVTEMAHA